MQTTGFAYYLNLNSATYRHRSMLTKLFDGSGNMKVPLVYLYIHLWMSELMPRLLSSGISVRSAGATIDYRVFIE